MPAPVPGTGSSRRARSPWAVWTGARLLRPLAERYGRGSEMYANALGLGGAAGNEAAQGAFQEGPGYDYAVQQALQGVMRNASSLGNVASGNTAIALQDRGNQLANQEYGGWLDRLSGYDPLAMGAAGAQAGISTGLGDRLLGTGWRSRGHRLGGGHRHRRGARRLPEGQGSDGGQYLRGHYRWAEPRGEASGQWIWRFRHAERLADQQWRALVMAWFGGGFGNRVGNMMGGLGDRLQAGGRALGGGQGMPAGNPYTSGTGGAFGQGGGSAGEYGNYGALGASGPRGFMGGGMTGGGGGPMPMPGRGQPFGDPSMPMPILRPQGGMMQAGAGVQGYPTPGRGQPFAGGGNPFNRIGWGR